MLPSNWRSDDRVDRPRCEAVIEGAEDGAGAAARGAGPGVGRAGSGGMVGCWGRSGWAGAGALVLLNKLISCSEEAGGVLGPTVQPDLVMKVDAGGASGGSHGADALAETDRLAGLDPQGVQMGVARLETATV